VTLVVHDPRSPTSIGWAGDDRPLGLHLRAVSFGSVRSSGSVGRLIRRLLSRARAGMRGSASAVADLCDRRRKPRKSAWASVAYRR
jgi:hypothetical protein